MSAKTTSTALAVILALSAAPLMAQTPDNSTEATPETEASQAAPETPAAEAETEAEAEASETPAEAPAETAPAEPQVGAYYPRASHGDWTLRCIKTADAADPCELYQLLQDGQGNSVAEITMIPLEGGQAATGATIVTPLETDLTQGIRMQVDSGQARAYPFNFCAPVGCIARVGLTAAELTSFKRGNAAVISVLPYGATEDQAVNLTM
ncbi:MAG: invasion associated locus B family protein, partial [Paracoccus sp. (in: a-proteobacteria)]|nr:invasion associated locus B family protein [Paracoccus sp. (in: a-proteobacteria)]